MPGRDCKLMSRRRGRGGDRDRDRDRVQWGLEVVAEGRRGEVR